MDLIVKNMQDGKKRKNITKIYDDVKIEEKHYIIIILYDSK